MSGCEWSMTSLSRETARDKGLVDCASSWLLNIGLGA
jgi:hypothetical protein